MDFPEDLDLKELVGRVIARLRNDVEMSQEKLAEIANLERGYISLIERGKRMPTLETLFRLCRGLKIDPSEVVREIELLVGAESKRRKR